MDSPITAVEALRAKLKALPRSRVLGLADTAGVPRSTVEKFRNGHTEEIGSIKFEALCNALAEDDRQAA